MTTEEFKQKHSDNTILFALTRSCFMAFEQNKGILAVDTRILLNPPENEGS